jgi:hypothetical protein
VIFAVRRLTSAFPPWVGMTSILGAARHAARATASTGGSRIFAVGTGHGRARADRAGRDDDRSTATAAVTITASPRVNSRLVRRRGPTVLNPGSAVDLPALLRFADEQRSCGRGKVARRKSDEERPRRNRNC